MLKNRFQQLVAVIGMGIGLWFLGSYITLLGQPSSFGWVAYAPLSHAIYGPGLDLTSAEQFLVWLGLIVVWVVLIGLDLKDHGKPTPN